nr:hypothetical protein [Candidatus Sigynarchaeota archaeon]
MPETEIKLVIEKNQGLGLMIRISREAAARIGVQNGDIVSVKSPSQGIEANMQVNVADVYPFIVQVDPDTLNALKIKSVDLTLSRSVYKRAASTPATQATPAPVQAYIHPPVQASVPSPPVKAAPVQATVPSPPVKEANATPSQLWVLVPNQIDDYQNLVVDSQGNPIYGFDTSGYPLDSQGNTFTAANYYDLSGAQAAQASGEPSAGVQPEVPSPPVPAPPAPAPPAPVQPAVEAKTEIKSTVPEKVQMIEPNQVDAYGVQVSDSSGNPIYGLDPSGWYLLDSAGAPIEGTRWMEVDAGVAASGAKFNAILIIDISRSMMARDLEVKDADVAIRTIMRTMKSPKIQHFLNQFKEGTLIPRRMGAALATITFLAIKMARGHGEKVAVIRFADMAETLDFDGVAFMDSAGSAQDVMERMATSVVENIGNSYGQATEAGKALYLAMQLINLIKDMEAAEGAVKPVLCVMLTDGYPTDSEMFANAIEVVRKDAHVAFDIIVLGASSVDLMEKAVKRCGGEYFVPADLGQLISWYTRKATEFKARERIQEPEEEP